VVRGGLMQVQRYVHQQMPESDAYRKPAGLPAARYVSH
jgi:hypothetical protein